MKFEAWARANAECDSGQRPQPGAPTSPFPTAGAAAGTGKDEGRKPLILPPATWVLFAFACLAPMLIAGAADKNGVSPNAISLPAGPGSLEGLGESFQPALNSGTAHYGFSLVVPPGTAGHTPALHFSYDGGLGNEVLGTGWRLPLPCVQRRTDHAIPRYIDAPNGKDDNGDGTVDEPGELDTFLDDAKEELVPVAGGDSFARNEESFIRYRRTGDHWEATRPDGTRLEFGLTDNGRISDGSTNRIFKWLLERETDPHGNTIVYSWTALPGGTNTHQRYLQEVRYGPGSAPWTDFHFAAFTYEGRSDWFEDGRSGFLVRTGARLQRITIGTQTAAVLDGHAPGDFNHDGLPDHLDREYRLTYLDATTGASHGSLLREILQVGADGTNALPPLRFGYALCQPPASVSASAQLIGGLNEPPTAMDNANFELVDLNADGLPDLLRTGAAGGVHLAYLNRGEQTNAAGRVLAWAPAQEVQSQDGFPWNITLQSANEVAYLSDMDGDGLADLTFKSALGDLFYFSNLGHAGWGKRQQMSLQDAAPPAPFGDANVRTADLDFDKRMDVIQSIASGGGADYRIWFNLGQQRFARSVTVPQASGWMFSAAGVFLADFNGDRVPDLVRLQPTGLTIAAGLGYGNFAPPVTVPLPDYTLDASQIAKARLEDISGDGLADLVIERAAPGQIWYWINPGNYTLESRRLITGLPGGLSTTTRWADMNGDGRVDLVYADSAAAPKMLTVDLGRLLGSVPAPNTLIRIENGLGRVQTIEYAPSTRFALEDAAHGQAWTNQLPFPVSVVWRVLTEDSLGHSYETRFSYHQGYYDAAEKEFRGFAVAEKIETGDTTAPTLVTRSSFDVGREFEAMKGRQLRLTTEQEDGQPFWDEATTWTTPPRLLHAGANGRDVVFVHPTGRRKVISELGQGDPRTVESEFAYDEFGNQTLEANYGIVENGDRSAWDDERVTTNSFAINLDAWILRRPSRTEVRDEEGTVLSRAENFYDDPTFSGNNLGAVTRGDLTLRREWFDAAQPGSYVASLRAQFDAFGNRILLLDPLAQAAGGVPVPAAGHYREVAYDDRFHAYPVQETLHVGAARPALQAGAEHDFGFGRLTATHDFNGLITSCRYDAFGRLLSLARPGDSPEYPSTEYAYGLAQPVGSNGLVNFVETRRLDQPAAAGTPLDHYHVTRQFFDGLGRALLTKTEAEGPAATPNQPRVILTGATLFNARLQPWRVLAPCFSTQPGASLEALLAYESVAAPDWVGRFHVKGVEQEADLAGAPQTTTEYDALLRAREVTQADGAHRRNFYGPLASEQSDENDTDPSSPHAGTPSRFVFDGLGRQVRTEERVRLNDDGTPASEVATWVTEFAWDLNDQLVRITDAQHNVKALRYDGLKRLLWMNDPDRGVSTYAYDPASNRIQSEDARGQKIRFTYDGVNRLIAEDYLDENAPFSRHHPFDPAQPISTQNRPDVAYFYDQAVANLDFGDGTTGTARNVLGELGYAWDLSGEEHFSYDERRRHEWSVKRILDPADPASARLTSFRTVHEYDRLDRETRLIYPDNDEITFQYNSRQLLQSISGGWSGSIVTRQDYLPSGQLGQAEFGNGVQTRYAYDARARLQRLSVAPAHGPGAPLLDLSYELDGASNLIGLADQRPALVVPAGDPRRNSQTFAYDDLYRLTRAGYSFAAPGGATTDGAVQCRYDRLGNLLHQSASVAVPAGEPDPSLGDLHYGGAAGTSGRVGRTSQDPGPHALTSLVNSGDTEEILYDENGNVVQLEGSTATWDFLNRLVAVESDTMGAEYTYDHHNQRVTRRVTAKSGAAAGRKPDTTLYVDKHFEVRNGTPVKYVFNPAGRVARVTGSLSTRARVQRLQLQPGWNLVSLAITATNAAAQLKQPVAGQPSPVLDVFRWNAPLQQHQPVANGETVPAGSVLWIRAGAAAVRAVTGAVGAPAPMQLPAGASFVAAPGLETISLDQALTGPGDAWQFDAEAQQWSARLDLPFALGTSAPHSLAPGEALCFRSAAPVTLEVPEAALSIRYYHQDHLGSSAVITDANGQLVEETAYLPFGGTRHTFRPRDVAEAYGFTGKEQDAETGWHYFEERFMASRLGRFLGVDPLYADPQQLSSDQLGRLLGSPQKLNLYAYAKNNPLAFIDPTGCDDGFFAQFTAQALVKEAVKQAAAAQAEAQLLEPGGKRTVISGHGRMLWPIDFAKEHGVIIESKDPMPGYTRVPAGTSVTFYSRHGQSLMDTLGNAIEQGTVNKNQPRETYGPGELIPDYRIYPPDNLNIMKGGKDITVVTLEHPTQLSSLLKEGMGKVDVAACRKDKHFPEPPAAIDWNTFGDKKKE